MYNNKGFAIAEVMIVFAMLALLTAVAIPAILDNAFMLDTTKITAFFGVVIILMEWVVAIVLIDKH